ncbi:ectoine/hydroxyectoine ABC transporter permease subunit EhuD [Labrenzia sp. DG1229]|uniref:ectoine/hydroxyectoine ABC transporter permease subunit EhuD n=1 Tax=Labrenzia sp. DG1229 TaxID=681847 RepID=UPI00048D20EA|nr:ectoine/hydroxyectoine ABC transporter permease subunit EhuD [Labrenzia sp. DG1229]
MGFDFEYALSIVPQILKALPTTFLVTVLCCFCAAVLAFAMEFTRRSGRILGYVMRFIIDAIRSTPILAQLYFVFFVLPFYGLTLPPMVVGVLGLSVYYSGYLAEVYKAGIDAIPRGQWDAAKALHLSRWDTISVIIAPQMLRNIAAPMGNYFVSILKATPYLAVIAVPEMLGEAFDIASDTFRYAEPILVVGIIFLSLALVIAQLVRLLEERMQQSLKR